MIFVQCKRKPISTCFGNVGVQDLWSNVQEILTSNNIEIQLSYFNISFEINCKNKPKNLVFNFIVLLVKYYIFPQNINYKDPL